MKALALPPRRLQRTLRRLRKLVRPYRPCPERPDMGDDDPCELIGPGNEHGDRP